MGASKYLNEKNPDIKIIGLQPGEGAKIPGIRRWSKEYLPSFFDSHALDSVIDISTREAEETTRYVQIYEQSWLWQMPTVVCYQIILL